PETATRKLIEEIQSGTIAPAAPLVEAVAVDEAPAQALPPPSPQRGEGGEQSEPGAGRSESQSIILEPLTAARLRPADYAGQALSPASTEALAKADAGRGGRRASLLRRHRIAASLAALLVLAGGA